MRRRLRKKKRLGEFREFGFEVRLWLSPDADYETFWDRLIDAVETRRLGFGGGGGTDCQGFISRLGRGSATDEDRDELGRFFAGDPVVVRHELGPLVDAWR
jgi:uncharacterized protein YggL (DUF469 family)